MLGSNILYRMVNLAVVFIVNILLTRLAGAAGYGVLSLLIANATIFNLLSGLGADAGITYNTASGKLAGKKIFASIFYILLLQVFLLLLVEITAWMITGRFFLFKTSQLEYAWLGILFFISVSLVEKYSAWLAGLYRFSWINASLLLANLLLLATLGYFYFTTGNKPVVFYVGVYVLFSLLQALLLILLCHGKGKQPISLEIPGKEDRKAFFTYSLFAFVINGIQFLAYRVDYWLLDHYYGDQELGLYALAVRLSQLFWVLPLLFASIILPAVAGGTLDRDAGKMHALIRTTNLVNLAAGLAIFLLAPWLLPFLFGAEYVPSVSALQILLPGVILFCYSTFLAAWFGGRNQLRVNFAGSVICLLVILILDLVLIPRFGIRGAAWASSIGYGITGIYYVVMYSTRNKLDAGTLFFPSRTDLGFLKNFLGAYFLKK